MAAYLVVLSEMLDRALYKEYQRAAAPTLAEFNGKLLGFDDDVVQLEGDPPGPRCVLIEFESKERALEFYNCDAYQEALPKRLQSTRGVAVIAEGFVPR